MKLIPSSIILSSILALTALPAYAQAPAYPDRPVRVIVPAAPGGAADLLARVLMEHLGAAMKANFVIENKAGAAGIIGVDAAAKAPADGYTLLLTSNSIVSTPAVYKVQYDVQRDFSPVGLVASIPNVLVASPTLGAKTFGDLLAIEKRDPGKLSFGTMGVATAAHMTVEIVQQATGMHMLHVPFKGVQQAMTETLAGRVPLTIAGLSNALPYINSGKLTALAISGKARSPMSPGIPTFSELGVKGADVALWFALFAPADTPPGIVQKLNQELNRTLKDPAVIEQLARLGCDPIGGSSAELADTAKTDELAFAAIVKTANIKVE